MKKVGFLILFLLAYFPGFAQAPANDECSNAKQISVQNYCSAVGEFSNANATESFIGNGRDTWFKFTATAFEISITVTGTTLQSPRIGMSTGCDGSVLIGSTIVDGNSTIYTKGGLTPGRIYYFYVSGANNNTGTFKLCAKNYNPPTQPGQDFPTASILCSTASFPAINITGAGLNNKEAAGTCMVFPTGESNSAWYKWTAANNGTLVFTITPTKNDDIDWALFDLGVEGATQTPSGNNVIRCAAGHGIDNSGCPNEPLYTKTGLDFSATDVSEQGGCGQGQNGVVKYVDMIPGHVYALLIDNFSTGNNGFTIDFTDRNGKAGTGEFVGPKGAINLIKNKACTIDQNFNFTTVPTNYTRLKWYFGEGASIDSSDVATPPVISYKTPGEKTVVLQLFSNRGCSVVYTESFMVGIKPEIPIINGLKSSYCTLDSVVLNITPKTNETYQWSGPNGFTSTLTQIKIPVTGLEAGGKYSVTATLFGCTSDIASTTVTNIVQTPTAAFTTDPVAPAKLAFPVTVKFFNSSKNADSFSWDFGDGTPVSNEVNPEHTYTGKGNFDVTLTAFNSNSCSNSIIKGTFIVSESGIIFIPNTFTPNNDAVNDEFVVSMNNI
ncbi:MAG: PKD domain-containing protein, partial [Bacteroidota bacterium]